MARIRIDLQTAIVDGQSLTFKSPADCSDITGLVIYYPAGNSVTSSDFQFVDAHGVDVGSGTISLFSANALVKIILDTTNRKAYVQNADTNAYLEGELNKKYSPDNKPSPSDIGASPTGHKHTKSEITDFPTTMTPSSHNQAASTITAGTFGGQVVAGSSNQTPGTSLLRNSKLVSSESYPTVNGEINWMYE